ncbi:MAG: BMC domain-containing protein [Acidimicrobiia bacterium]|nr:BMC domain-containing protein [Acidimicrobiia bacterium]
MTQQKTEIRALLQIDRLQPRFAAYSAATVRGSIPLEGDTLLVGEISPGNEVFRAVDVALKAAEIESVSQIVEREFGFFMLRSPVNTAISMARQAILDHLGANLSDRIKPQIDSTQRITSVEPHQAKLLNIWRQGSLVIPGETLGIMECSPAAYIAFAANEAEKAANVDIVEVRALGRFGRLFIAGSEDNVSAAIDAAVAALEGMDGNS